MTIKQVLFSALILGASTNVAFGMERGSTNIHFYTYGLDHTFMSIDLSNGIQTKGSVYNNDSIVINKNRSGEISTHHIGDLQSIENAFITHCSNFDVIEHGANTRNKALCKNTAILEAYEQFKKDHDKK